MGCKNFCVTVAGNFVYEPLQVAKLVAIAYVEALEKFFPDHFFVIDEGKLKI